jgi:hypothetical protein
MATNIKGSLHQIQISVFISFIWAYHLHSFIYCLLLFITTAEWLQQRQYSLKTSKYLLSEYRKSLLAPVIIKSFYIKEETDLFCVLQEFN